MPGPPEARLLRARASARIPSSLLLLDFLDGRRRIAVVDQIAPPLQIRVADEQITVERAGVHNLARVERLRAEVDVAETVERIAQRHEGDEADRTRVEAHQHAGAVAHRRGP